MTKDKLKYFVTDLKLDGEVSELIFDLIDGAPEVNKELLNAVSDIIDMQADFHEKIADAFEEEAESYELLAAEANTIDEEEVSERMNAMKENQEKLLSDLTAALNTIQEAGKMHSVQKDQDEVEKIKQSLHQTTM